MNTSTVILKNCKSFVLKDEYKKGAFYTDTRVVYMYKYKLMTVLKHGQDWSILKADKIPSMERRGGWHKGHPFLKSNEKLLCGKKNQLIQDWFFMCRPKIQEYMDNANRTCWLFKKKRRKRKIHSWME